MIKVKRVYEEWTREDGFRILVDRLWPRGLTKEKAHLDLWMKEIAPSTELRKWFGHDPEKWEEFTKRYLNELNDHVRLLNQLKTLETQYKTITLVYGARDTKHNEAVILVKRLA